MKSKPFLCLALVLTGSMTVSCSKKSNSSTTEVANTNAFKDLTAKVETSYSNFIPAATAATTNFLGTNYSPIVPKVLTSFETNVVSTLTNSAMVEIIAGEEFLKNLKLQGHLPGMVSDSHATVTTGDLPTSNYQAATYPFSMTFHITPSGDLFTNHYTIVRASRDAAWQLQKAWRTDAEGHTIKEWPTQ